PAFRPRGWDERRSCHTNWDTRWNNYNQSNDNWWNNNRWSNNRDNDNWWNRNQWDNRWSSLNNNNRFDDNRMDQLQRSLAERIRHGSKDGSLSADEASQLRNRFRDIERQEQRFRSGGFTANERQQLDTSLNRLNRDISRERHDND